jgi:hypothetical protein
MGKEDTPPRPTSQARFDCFIGIDYSGAGTSVARLKGLQWYDARPGQAAARLAPPSAKQVARTGNWTRREVAHMLLDRARGPERFIAGIDHCFSMPGAYMDRHGLTSWPAFLDDFVQHWPAHEDQASVQELRASLARLAEPDRRTGKPSEFRLAEQWTSSAKSVFQFDMQGSVAKSSHAGIPWLKWLRDQAGDRLHFWPFDGWEPAPGKSVIAEVYPSILRRRYPVSGLTGDEQDAYAVATWLADMAGRGALGQYFAMPPLTEAERRIVACEGWVLGVR